MSQNTDKRSLGRAIGQVVRKHREDQGLTIGKLISRIRIIDSGFSADVSAFARKERGETFIKPPERSLIAKALGLTIEQFDAEWRGSRVERSLGDERGIPVVNRAPAGQIINYKEYGVDSGQGFEYLDWGAIKDDLAFAVVVVGDSMEPSLYEGDYVLLKPMRVLKSRVELEDGVVVLVRFTPESGRDGCTLGRWFCEGDEVEVRKDNRRHRSIRCRREDIEHVSVLIERRTKRV